MRDSLQLVFINPDNLPGGRADELLHQICYYHNRVGTEDPLFCLLAKLSVLLIALAWNEQPTRSLIAFLWFLDHNTTIIRSSISLSCNDIAA